LPTRLLHIIPTLDRAGAEKQLLLLATHLPRDQFDVHVCALTRGGPRLDALREADVSTKVIGKRFKADPIALGRLRRHIAALKPQIVHTWMFAAGAYGRTAARQLGVAHLVHAERCIDRWKARWQWSVDRFLARRTDRIVANTPGVRDYCVQHGIEEHRLIVIPNGVAAAHEARISRRELLERVQLPSDARVIAAIGRLWPQKGIKELIWATELVAVLHPTVFLLVIGEGPQRGHLEKFAQGASSLERVRFLGERDDVPQILPHVDVLWQGSEYEGMPNAVMEAMAAAVPVVATDIPGNRDLVIDGETGYLVPIGDRAAYARATDRILGDADHARRLGKAGRDRVERDFSIAQMVKRYVELYETLMSGSASAH